MSSPNTSISVQVHYANNIHDVYVAGNEVEIMTQQTWEDLLGYKRIPSLFLAVTSLKGADQPRVYEATNFHHYLKIERLKYPTRSLVDPLSKLPIENIKWIFTKTFQLDEKGHIRESRPPYKFHEIREPSIPDIDWLDQECNVFTQVTLTQCFSKGLNLNQCSNPLLPTESLAQLQFVAGCTLLDSLLHINPGDIPRTKTGDSPPNRSEITDEGIRYLTCSKINGSPDAGRLIALISKGHFGIYPPQDKIEKWANETIKKLNSQEEKEVSSSSLTSDKAST